LRNIRSPIVAFCSKGDNVTPPQQALGWILDLYDSVDDIRCHGQTIVYTIHESIGHLGIFVSGGVAKKQHDEFSSNIDLIDTLPSGLYEAVFESKAADTANPDLVTGNWVMRCEARTLDDIRALGGNDAADERRFATAASVSEINLAIYRSFVQPAVRAAVNPVIADWLKELHPLRWQYTLFSDANPMMAPIAKFAETVRGHRNSVAADNPFVAMQEQMSRQIVAMLDGWRQVNETVAERLFLAVYGSPALQATVGIDRSRLLASRKMGNSPLHQDLLERRITEIRSRIPAGGLREAVIRVLLYVGMTRSGVDERGFEAVQRIRAAHGEMPLAAFKALVREQFNMLLLDTDAALAAIPSMLPNEATLRREAFDLVKTVMTARGPLSDRDDERLRKIAQLFGLAESDGAPPVPFRPSSNQRRAATR
jgi:hypothetical protein